MSEKNHCPQCGAALPAQSPQGLCPGCLLKWGLESQTGGKDGGSQPGAADRPPPTPEEIAAYFPDLEILELVGRGGMGVVYKARQKRLDRLVALKILAPKIGQDPAFAERFAREARAMAMLSHPHVVAVHDFGQIDGLYYFLMEFVDGVNLRRLLDTGKLAPEEALAIVPQICEALQYAHDHGVVHRDIKPENLLLDKEGRVKIADFGIAKLVGKDAKDLTLTGAGQIIGTPQYMAPEQIEHPLQVDHRADIYSLGVVFYQMLTGELPIGRFAPPSKKVQIDVRLDEVVLRALEKEPERRYQEASEIKTQVETIAQDSGQRRTGARLPLVGLHDGRRAVSGRGLGVRLIVIATVTAIVVLFTYSMWPNRPLLALGSAGYCLFFMLIPLLVMLIVGFRTPLQQLAPLDVQDRPGGEGGDIGRPAIAALRWTARVFGTMILLFFLFFAIGEGVPGINTSHEPVAQATRVETVGLWLMMLGLVIGWKWEGLAAILILAGAMEFHIVEWRFLMGPLDWPLLVGALYGLCWWMGKIRPRAAGSAGASGTPPPDGDTVEEARREVNGPAVGLIVTSLVNWLTIFFVLPGFVFPLRSDLPPRMPLNIFLLVCAILALGSAFILIGALKMHRLDSLTWARVASVLAMLIGPGYIVGWPVGIWALVVLSQRDVRAAFGRRREHDAGSAAVLPPDDVQHPNAAPPSTGEASGTAGLPAKRGLSPSQVAWLVAAFALLMAALFYLSNYYQQRSMDMLQWENSLLQREVGRGDVQIEQRLHSFGIHWENYSVELSPNSSLRIWHFVGLREFKVVNGTNTRTNITGNLHVVVLKDGDWQISGDGQLGHVKFIMAAPSIAAAESWLALADDGRYAESWDAAAEFLKNAVGKDNFVKSLNAARKPLGKLKSREIKSKEFRTSLPGAPNGEYVVIQFRTSFENKEASVETVTPMLGKDKKWRVSGYYIK